jgi:diaminohydroxyphosphoribosylaminopyrimidine deaminase / 5-amino-6-(5-phosphoribosylamino)uracil reductase
MAAGRATDSQYMAEALRLAERRLGLTSPNPAVGCLLVRDGRIVARGVTAAGGRPHAEAIALARAGRRARGATAYVTFEPCAHRGRTPSCARALIDAGVRRAVVGCVDPYPPVRGRGIAILRRAGIRVTVGLMKNECRRLNEGFITRVTRRRPFVLLKLAMSLDGRIAAAGGDSRWISSEASRALVHRWRRECDAVMVGAGTVVADDPQLTCRIPGGRDPVRVVIDPSLRAPADSRVYRGPSDAPAILVTSSLNLDPLPVRIGHLQNLPARHPGMNVEVLETSVRRGEIALDELMREFGQRGWCKVMIEGGAHLAGAALRAGIVDRIAFFVAPRIIGAGLPAVEGLGSGRVRDAMILDDLSVRRVGDDWLFEARPRLRRRSRSRPLARSDAG